MNWVPLNGIIPPLVTPLKSPDTLDVDGLERLIEHLVSGGVHGLFVLGTTGEGPCLPGALQREVVNQACRIAAGRLPVWVGISDASTEESIALGRYAAGVGATAVVATPPLYIEPDPDELTGYIEHIVGAQPLPLFLYNIPGIMRATYSMEVIRRATQFDRVVGVKDSSGDIASFRSIVEVARLRPDWRVYVGSENLLVEAIRSGGHGGVHGGGLVFPKLLVGLYQAACSGDAERISRLEGHLAVLSGIYSIEPGTASFIKGVKASLSCLGICGDTMTRPFRPLSPEGRERIVEIVESLRPVLAAEFQGDS